MDPGRHAGEYHKDSPEAEQNQNCRIPEGMKGKCQDQPRADCMAGRKGIGIGFSLNPAPFSFRTCPGDDAFQKEYQKRGKGDGAAPIGKGSLSFSGGKQPKAE